MEKKILYILLGFSLFACSFHKKQKNQIDDNLSLSWKNDSLGCLGYRNKNRAEELNNKYNVVNGNIKNLTDVFGKPTATYPSGRYIIYSYVYGVACDSGIRLKDSDACWVKFYTLNEIVESVNFVCN